VVEALQEFIQQRHLEKIENYHFMLPKLQQLRDSFARLVNGRAQDIAFVPNTSAGLNLLATGLDWRPGDRILLNSLEFPANVYPFLNCQRLGVEVDFVAPREHLLRLEDIAAAITPRTRLFSISQVQFLTGQRMDLAAISALCKQHGIIFCVDGIQALGASHLDVQALGIDFVASGGHKWLMGAQGFGFVYVSPELLPQLQVAQVGWLTVEDAWNMLDYHLKLRPDAARFETGSFNALGLTVQLASQQVFERWPQAQITQQVLDLSAYLIEGLQNLGLEVITPIQQRLGIVTCLHPEAERLMRELAAQQIHVSMREGRYLRFSPHYYNSTQELAKTLERLRGLLGLGPKYYQLW
jgi:selenocysteine lyase/cysteine desulfurase